MVSKHGYMSTYGLRDMGLGHSYYGEIDTSVIAWSQNLGTLIPRISLDGFKPLHSWCVQICVQCL